MVSLAILRDFARCAGQAGWGYFDVQRDFRHVPAALAGYIESAFRSLPSVVPQFYALFVVDCLLLGYLGAMPAEGIYIVLARIGTVYYFAHFLIVLPMLGIIERPKDVPESISSPVLSAQRTG